MRVALLSFLLVFSLFQYSHAYARDYTSVLQSITFLTEPGEEVEYVQICTAFSINEKEGYWVTAAHCFHGHQLRILRNGASWDLEIILLNADHDIAIFKSVSAPALQAEKRLPRIGDDVYTVGFSTSPHPIFSFGKIIDMQMPPYFKEWWPKGNILVQGGSLKGMSGAPTMTLKGKVIAVNLGHSNAQTGMLVSFKSLYEGLLLVTGDYWE